MRSEVTPGKLEGAGTPFNWPTAIGYGRQPFANVPASAGTMTAGPNGVQLGLFGWADPVLGEVSNESPGILGFVLPVPRAWNWQKCTPTLPGSPVRGLILRAGLACVLAASGDFVTTFPFGAQAGNQVFTDPATGVPYSGNPGGLVATPWTVMSSACGCNARVRISSFVAPFN